MSEPAFTTATPSTRPALPLRRRCDGDEREGVPLVRSYPLEKGEARGREGGRPEDDERDPRQRR